MSTAGSIPDSQLGLTQSELMILRQTQEVAAQASRAGSTAMADRGRGTSRASQPSSRAASAASSHSIQGRITMDSTSLGRIENALTNMARAIQARIEAASHFYQPGLVDMGTNIVFTARRGRRSNYTEPISWSFRNYASNGPRNREIQKDHCQTRRARYRDGKSGECVQED